MILRRSTVAAVLFVAPLLACEDPARPDTSVELAHIENGAADVVVTADAGELLVAITTWGDPCTTRHHDDVDIDPDARVITIRPYNEREDGLCFASAEPIPHDVRVDPGADGAWLVRVIGRGVPASVDPENPQETTVVVERQALIPAVTG